MTSMAVSLHLAAVAVVVAMVRRDLEGPLGTEPPPPVPKNQRRLR
jgi:hypothetical protein